MSVESYKNAQSQLVSICDNYELAFIASAMIAFVSSDDSWEAWDVLQKVCMRRKVQIPSMEKSKLAKCFLAKPQQLVDEYNSSGIDILGIIKEIVFYWKTNEFYFQHTTRYLAAEMITHIIETRFDVTSELMCLMRELNPVKMIEKEVNIQDD